jgi:hypothetical protein
VDLPPRVKEIIRLMYERHRDLAHGDDDARRTLTRMIAEQIAYEFGPRWGTKAQSPSHPPSKDAIAFQTPDGQLFAWDWQNGATREPFDEPVRHTITGQHFIAVTPKNHLGAPPPTPTPPADLQALVAAVQALSEEVRRVRETLDALQAQAAKVDTLRQELFAPQFGLIPRISERLDYLQLEVTAPRPFKGRWLGLRVTGVVEPPKR